MSAITGERTGWGAPAAVFVAAVLLLGVQALRRDYPPDTDQAFYLNVARSLAEGRGFQADTVNFYLLPIDSFPVPSNSYWMPLPSVLIAPFIAIHDSHPCAMVPVVLWSALAAALVCVFACRILGSRVLGVTCGLLYVCHPLIRFFGTSSDSSVLFAALALGGFLLYADLARNPRATWRAVALGVLVGLCVLTRADSLVTLSGACFAALGVARWRGLEAPTQRQILLAIGAAALVLLPWSIRCMLAFGQPWMPASGKTLLISSYSELFAWKTQPSWATYQAALAADPALPLRRGITTLASLFRLYAMYLGHWSLGVLTVVGTGLLLWIRRPGRTLALVAVLETLALCFSFAFLTGALGPTARSWTVILPLILVATMFPLQLALERWTPTRVAAVLRALVLAGALTWALIIFGEQALLGRPPLGPPPVQARYAALEAFLSRDTPARMPVITLYPAETHYATRRPTLPLPSDGIDATLDVARRFETNLILLSNDSNLLSPEYSELLGLYTGERPHPAFRLVYERDGWKLFRCETGAAERR